MRTVLYGFLGIIISLFVTSGCSVCCDEEEKLSFSKEKKEVHKLFLTEYLWSDQVATAVDYNQYTTPMQLVNGLRVNPPDKWSYALTQQEYEAMQNQETKGFGFFYNQNYEILNVIDGSPAQNKLQRGDRILKINDQNITYETLLSAKESGASTLFTLLRDGNSIDINLTAIDYGYTVTRSRIIEQNGKKIGYIQYDSFTESSSQELEAVFTTFKQNEINELVVDLRYNGGGLLYVASALLDNITNAYPSQRQLYLDWNDNYESNNADYRFESIDTQDGNELTMQKVYFLVTKDSASASEAVINALVPYLGSNNVITIGNNTHGKPVGMGGVTFKGSDNYYFLINFYVKNNDGITTSFDGIAPTCSVEDNPAYQLGDQNETMLATALYYIQNGNCPN